MTLTNLRFYLNENVSPEIADQVRRGGIDAVHVRDLEMLGDSDENHLQRATQAGRVLCTHDQDFLVLASQMDHAGSAFGDQTSASIGNWVRALRRLHAEYQAEDALNRIFFVKLSQ